VSVALPFFAHGEAGKVTQKVALLEGKPVVARQARDTAKAKLLGLVDRSADIDQ
jgi:hypothetical protein